MQIALLDLMPVLFGMCALAAAILAIFGDFGALSRTAPAAAAAFALYFTGFPPRAQVAAFAAVFVLAGAVYRIVCAVGAFRRRRAKKQHLA